MIKSTLNNVSISCICAAVPDNPRSVKDDWKGEEGDIQKVIKNTGVHSRYVTDTKTCTSDLCFEAVQAIFKEKNIDPLEIDGLIFVTQTPDTFLPATSCALHGRLGLSKNCATFDVNLGCSGYVYGLCIASTFISSGSLKKVLVLSGDTITKLCDESDRSTWPLFGDAGSATLVEHDDNAGPLHFVIATDGNGADKLEVKNGAFRNPGTPNLFMSGSDIFTFTIREVPPMIKEVLELSKCTKDDVDFFVFHQANAFILNYLSKKAKLDNDKVLVSLDRFGNTSSASIPLTVVANKEIFSTGKKAVFSGFGVGFSWGAVAFDSSNVEICSLQKVSR